MPTFREYADNSGYYIRSNIEGSFLTMQLSPQAEGLLTELGYGDGDSIVWPLLHPLCDSGDVFTNKSGTDISPSEEQVESALSSGKLSSTEKARVKEFLGEGEAPEGPSVSGDGSNVNRDIDTIVNDQAKSFIKQWSQSKKEYEATLTRLASSGDPDGIVKSVNQHSTHHPIQPRRFQVSSRGVPVYSFETLGIPWVVHHFDPLEVPHVDASIFVEIRPGTSTSQSITMSAEGTEWHTTGDRFSSAQVDDFLAVAPDLLYYYHYHPNKPTGYPYSIIDNPSGNLSATDRERVAAFDDVRSVSVDTYGQSLGVILSKGKTGHGRLRAHTGHEFPYNSDHVEGGDPDVGSLVSFQVAKYKHGLRARPIHIEETDGTPEQIVTGWPSLRERSKVEVRSELSSIEEGPSQTNQLSITIGPDDADTTTFEITVSQSVYWALRINEDEPDEIVDSALRNALKNYIDGTVPETVTRDATVSVTLELPDALHGIVESAVSTSDEYATASEFTANVLETQVAPEDREMLVEVAGGQYAALEYLATQRDCSPNELVDGAVDELLESAPELSLE